MVILKVEDMHCNVCVERISKALTQANINFEVNLEQKTVSVDPEKKDLAVEELDDLGFEVK